MGKPLSKMLISRRATLQPLDLGAVMTATRGLIVVRVV